MLASLINQWVDDSLGLPVYSSLFLPLILIPIYRCCIFTCDLIPASTGTQQHASPVLLVVVAWPVFSFPLLYVASFGLYLPGRQFTCASTVIAPCARYLVCLVPPGCPRWCDGIARHSDWLYACVYVCVRVCTCVGSGFSPKLRGNRPRFKTVKDSFSLFIGLDVESKKTVNLCIH